MSSYKPTENDGLKQDGTPDGRMNQDSNNTSTSASSDNSSNQPSEIYKPSEHDGLKKDGTPDQRTKSDHGFGSMDKEKVAELGRQGGSSS